MLFFFSQWESNREHHGAQKPNFRRGESHASGVVDIFSGWNFGSLTLVNWMKQELPWTSWNFLFLAAKAQRVWNNSQWHSSGSSCSGGEWRFKENLSCFRFKISFSSSLMIPFSTCLGLHNIYSVSVNLFAASLSISWKLDIASSSELFIMMHKFLKIGGLCRAQLWHWLN